MSGFILKYSTNFKIWVHKSRSYKFIWIIGSNGYFLLKCSKNITIVQKYNYLSFVSSVNSFLKIYVWLFRQACSGIRRFRFFFLELRGVGYKFLILKNNILGLRVGFSHLLKIFIPFNLKIKLCSSRMIKICGNSWQKVKEFCFFLRHLKPPGIYKNKGLYFLGEVPQLKEGKILQK